MPQVLGRESELAVIDRFFDSVCNGPIGLCLAGEAGIGKSTLLQSALADAGTRGFTVLSCQPSGAEVQVSYVALTDLLEPCSEVVRSRCAAAKGTSGCLWTVRDSDESTPPALVPRDPSRTVTLSLSGPAPSRGRTRACRPHRRAVGLCLADSRCPGIGDSTGRQRPDRVPALSGRGPHDGGHLHGTSGRFGRASADLARTRHRRQPT